MTKERMEKLMGMFQGIGVETEGGKHYFYEVSGMGMAFEDAVKRVNDKFSGMEWGKYKVFIAQSEEVERMINFHGEEVVIYETKDGDVVAVLENQAIRVFESVDRAIDKLYKEGFIF